MNRLIVYNALEMQYFCHAYKLPLLKGAVWMGFACAIATLGKSFSDIFSLHDG